MNQQELPKLEHALIKLVGVFKYSKKTFPRHATEKLAYKSMPKIILPNSMAAAERNDAIKDSETFLKNNYYKEFRGVLLTGDADSKNTEVEKKQETRVLLRERELKAAFKGKDNNGNDCLLGFSSPRQELFLFPDEVGMFSIQLVPDDFSLTGASDMINKARQFNSELNTGTDDNAEFQNWISSEVLGGISITGKSVEADEFSGSKLKVFAVYDIEKQPHVQSASDLRDLLFEMGTVSKLGSVSSNAHYAPSSDYYSKIESENFFSAFKNYEMLALLDSFSVLGFGNYKDLEDKDFYTFNTWFKTYFSMYIFTLYIRYSLYRHNVHFREDPLKQRDEFKEFLVQYNLRHISFNFLPNLIFEHMRKAMLIDEEIELFEKRLESLAQKVQEQQEKKQAALLGLISALSTLQSIDPVKAVYKQAKTSLGLPEGLFWTILVLMGLGLGWTAFWFFMPFVYRKTVKKIKTKLGLSTR
jgi:hypothetical protein